MKQDLIEGQFKLAPLHQTTGSTAQHSLQRSRSLPTRFDYSSPRAQCLLNRVTARQHTLGHLEQHPELAAIVLRPPRERLRAGVHTTERLEAEYHTLLGRRRRATPHHFGRSTQALQTLAARYDAEAGRKREELHAHFEAQWRDIETLKAVRGRKGVEAKGDAAHLNNLAHGPFLDRLSRVSDDRGLLEFEYP